MYRQNPMQPKSSFGQQGSLNPMYQRQAGQSNPLQPQAGMSAPQGGGGMGMPTMFSGYPQHIFSPDLTNQVINQQTALAQQRSALPGLLNSLVRPGMSNQSASVYAQALSPILDARMNDIAPRQQWQDSLANQQYGIGNQLLAHQDRMNLGNMNERFRGIQFGQQSGQMNQLVALLSQLLGG